MLTYFRKLISRIYVVLTFIILLICIWTLSSIINLRWKFSWHFHFHKPFTWNIGLNRRFCMIHCFLGSFHKQTKRRLRGFTINIKLCNLKIQPFLGFWKLKLQITLIKVIKNRCYIHHLLFFCQVLQILVKDSTKI